MNFGVANHSAFPLLPSPQTNHAQFGPARVNTRPCHPAREMQDAFKRPRRLGMPRGWSDWAWYFYDGEAEVLAGSGEVRATNAIRNWYSSCSKNCSSSGVTLPLVFSWSIATTSIRYLA